ncbi:MAG: hypothetical protein ACREH8_06305 [Opitutaceae bacterium]
MPRLAENVKPGSPAPVAANKFAVDALSTDGSAGSAKSRKAGLDVVTLPPGTEWSRPLRGSGAEPQFISFLFCASESTIIEIGGARLGVTLSPASGSLQFMFDEQGSGGLQWRSLGLHAPLEEFEGETLVSLPLLTVHLDPAAGVWSLYAGARLAADHLPLMSGSNTQQKFALKAGNGGAWLCQLIMADENPLYEDMNANGIDDAFENQKRGSLLATNASLADRKILAQQWQAGQRTSSPPPLSVRRPIPDRTTAGR